MKYSFLRKGDQRYAIATSVYRSFHLSVAHTNRQTTQIELIEGHKDRKASCPEIGL